MTVANHTSPPKIVPHVSLMKLMKREIMAWYDCIRKNIQESWWLTNCNEEKVKAKIENCFL